VLLTAEDVGAPVIAYGSYGTNHGHDGSESPALGAGGAGVPSTQFTVPSDEYPVPSAQCRVPGAQFQVRWSFRVASLCADGSREGEHGAKFKVESRKGPGGGSGFVVLVPSVVKRRVCEGRDGLLNHEGHGGHEEGRWVALRFTHPTHLRGCFDRTGGRAKFKVKSEKSKGAGGWCVALAPTRRLHIRLPPLEGAGHPHGRVALPYGQFCPGEGVQR
jgi:hypothetical protein